MIPTPTLIASAVAVAMLTAGPAFVRSARGENRPTGADPSLDFPSGVWVVSFLDVEEASRIPSMSDGHLAKTLGLNAPNISGVAPRIPWSLVNPQAGKFDWTAMDRILRLASSRGKKVAVRISAAASVDATPAWVWDRVRWWPTRGKQEGSRADKLRTPRIWDDRFVEVRAQLIRAMADRFDGEPAVQRVVLDDFALDNEMDYLREDRLSPADWKDIHAHEYYAREIVRSWKALTDLYAESFHRKPLFLNLTRLVIPREKKQKPALDWMIGEIAGHAQEKLGNRLYLQFNGLSESMPPADRASENPNLELLIEFQRRFSTVIGFQTVALGEAKTLDLRRAMEIALTYPVAYVEVIRDFWRTDRAGADRATEFFSKSR